MNEPRGHAPWPAVAAIVIGVMGAWAGARVYLAQRSGPAGPATAALPGHRAPAAAAADRGTADGVAADEEAVPPDEVASIRIPERLPEFSLNDREGKLRSIRDWHGKSLILNFWATWCAPCRREIPLLQRLAREWAPRDVATIGIAVDHRTEVLEFAARFHIDYPLLIGEEDALDTAAALGVDTPAFPFTVFTDRRGEVVAIFVGELRRAQADLILATVEDLNDDRLPLAAARHHISTGLRDLKEHAAG
jgi:thiol-disulfide isomerase/thioredoxin